jgi:hypothetical protein
MSKYDLCRTCAHVRQDKHTLHLRCHSPQLKKLRLPGILVNFERSEEPEPDRSHELGTGKCGPTAINRRPVEGAA